MRERIAALLQIRSGEGPLVVMVTGILLAANIGGAIGSPGVEALFYSRFGVDFLPYMYILLGLVTPLTSLTMTAVLSRSRLERFYVSMPLILAAVLVGFRLLLLSGVSWSFPVLWLGMNILWTLQALFTWGLAGLVCDTRQAKRLFPLFVVGGILGLTAGSFLTGPMVAMTGAENLILVWAIGLLVSFVLSTRLMAVTRVVAVSRRSTGILKDLARGLRYIRATDLLRWITLAAVFFAILFYVLTFPFARAVADQFPDENNVAAFLGTLSGVIYGSAVLVSLLFANRLYARLGFMTIVLIFPLIYLVGFTVSALAPAFTLLVAFRFAQMFWLEGLANGALQAMFNVVPPDHREQSRTFIQGVANPLGISLAGGMLLLANNFLTGRQLFAIGAVVAAWVSYLVWRARQAYGSAVVAALRAGHAHIFFGEAHPFGGFRRDNTAVSVALKGLSNPDVAVRRIAAEILGRLSLPEAVDSMVGALSDEDSSVRVALLQALGQSGTSAALLEVSTRLDDPEPEVRSQAIETLTVLTAYPAGVIAHVEPLLNDPDPAVRIKAAASLLRYEAHERAERLLLNAAASGPHSGEAIQLRIYALESLAGWGDKRALESVMHGLRDPLPAIRRASARVISQIDVSSAIQPLIDTLADEDRLVREAAAVTLGEAGKPALEATLAALADGDKEDGALLALEQLPVRTVTGRIKAYAGQQRDRALYYRRLWLGSRSAVQQLVAADGGTKSEETARLVADSLDDKSRLHAIRALKAQGLLGRTRAIKLAIEDLDSKDGAQQANAIETLDSLGDPTVVRPLLPIWEPDGSKQRGVDDWLSPMLVDDDPWIRACGAMAAKFVGVAPVTGNLEVLAREDPDDMVRECAVAALHGEKNMETLSSLSVMERILFLRRVPLFADLSPADLKQLAAAAGEHHFSDGSIIAEQGEKGDIMHIIVEGQIDVSARVADGTIRGLAVRGPGEYVGEMAMISEEVRMATLTAVGDVRTLCIDQRQFEETLRLRPETGLAVMRELCQRLRELPVV